MIIIFLYYNHKNTDCQYELNKKTVSEETA